MGRRRIALASMVALAAAGGAACAPEPEPIETYAATTAPSRPPNEARFELMTGDKSAGGVVVRSSGAYVGQVGADQRTVIAVELEVDNSGAGPVSIDPAELRLSSVRTTGLALGELAPAGSSSRVEVVPGAKQTAQAHFLLPPDVTPAAVQGYDLLWTVHEANGTAYRLTTSFVQQQGMIVVRPVYEAAPYPYGYYDGSVWFWGPPWPHAHFVFVPHYYPRYYYYPHYYRYGPHYYGHYGGHYYAPAPHGGGHFHGGGHH
jgi:hypothetical protein